MTENETVEKIEVVEEVEEVEEVVEPETPAAPEPLFCVVTDCARLNIRMAPAADAKVLCTVKAGDELMIDPVGETDEWHKVYTKAGVEGFCMKKFTR